MVGQDGTVRSVNRVISLFELFGERKSPLRLMEIAQALDIPKSTAHGLLQTLMSRELIVKDETTQHYRMGTRLFALAAAGLEVAELRELARPVMEELSRETQSTCNLAVLDGHNVMYLEKVEDPTSLVRVITHVGTRLPAHATSLGKALVASLPDAQRSQWIAEHEFAAVTPDTIVDPKLFASALDEARRVGWAVDRHEFHPVIWGVAAPIIDSKGQSVAALSLTNLDPGADLNQLGERVRTAAQEISRALQSTG